MNNNQVAHPERRHFLIIGNKELIKNTLQGVAHFDVTQ
jgi:hypothetical protein